MADKLDVAVVYARDLDVHQWREEHTAGRLPSEWPYGLNQLSGESVRATVVSPTSRLFPQRRSGPKAYDVAFSFDERQAYQTYALAKQRFSGVIWAGESPRRVKERLKRGTSQLALMNLDGVWSYSTALRDHLTEKYARGGPSVDYVPLGIDTDFYERRPYPEQGLVLSVGNDRSRDNNALLQALERIHDQSPRTRIVVQTNQATSMPSYVESYSTFGNHLRLKRFYEMASVIVVSTVQNLYTSGSTVALEAQSMGRPVVISDTPGMSEYVLHGTSGFLARTSETNSMADAVLNILSDGAMAAEMGGQGATHVRTSHTTAHMARAIREILIGSQPRSPLS